MSKNELKKALGSYLRLREQRDSISEGLGQMLLEAEGLRQRQEDISKTIYFLEGIIAGIKCDTRRRAVEGRYIKGMSNEEIAEEMCYSSRHIQRIITEAIEELTT